ncbi:hypothetical protein [Aurantiacibacter luteus]|uniref:Uncharacterized protein n=1 Tax=Aurantiacibacter luteus TaxID=1581420 RepID=A0A0G9MXQ8_9SPHN|nr:hypothetical protein [Aurantiacibacter luteus]KLE35521.1 hypothetical protein AAW00_03600 [Aurantiacibacter luteus]
MRKILPFAALIAAAPLLVAAQERLEQAPANPPPLFERGPLVLDAQPDLQLTARGRCDDTIHQVREERGLPRLDRRPADPDYPILFKAVDHTVDGCAVLVVNDGDIRPLPLPQEGPLRPQPAQ